MLQPALIPLSPYPDDFARWWAVYPNRVAKREALKAWNQTKYKRPSTSTLATITEQHAAVWRMRGTPVDKIPHPATWLRGERWLDELQWQEADTSWEASERAARGEMVRPVVKTWSPQYLLGRDLTPPDDSPSTASSEPPSTDSTSG